ncbi:MAG TPA: DUF4340 domain-containing protein [Candidatus Saccharimonadales bacterium]|nr:DUF4340 domain-containing protein [Candidatus Saccharimonadales bacterium]
MNRKQLILLLVALVILGGACLLLLNRHEESWSDSGTKLGQKVLPNFQVNDVAAIHIKGESDLDLVKKDDRWRVQQRNDYPANFSQISDLLIKMSDLKIAQAEPIGPSQMARMHLEDPGKGPDSATLIEFKDAQGKALQSLLVGKKHTRKSNRPSPMPGMDDQFPDGRFVMLKSDPGEVLTVSDPLSTVDPKPSEWLNKDFFKVEKPKSVSFVSTNAADSWTLTRTNENGAFVLSDVKTGEALDTNKVSSYSSTLSYPSFVDVVADASPAKTGMDKPLVVTIKTFDGFTYTLKIGAKTAENNYNLQVAVTGDFPATREKTAAESADAAKSLDKLYEGKMKQVQDKLKQEKLLEPWTYLVNNWLVDPLIRPRAQLMVEKKSDKKDDSAAPASTPEAPGLSVPGLEPDSTTK